MSHHDLLAPVTIGVTVQPGATCADVTATNTTTSITIYLSYNGLNHAGDALAAIATGKRGVDTTIHGDAGVIALDQAGGHLQITGVDQGARVTVADGHGNEVSDVLDDNTAGGLALALTGAAHGL